MNTSPRRLLCSDLDGTLLGDGEALRRFTTVWESAGSDRPVLCYNTGRALDDTLGLIRETGLPRPDYIVSDVGTSVFDVAADRIDAAYGRSLVDDGWNIEILDTIVAGVPGAVPQPPECRTPLKSSWFLKDASDRKLRRIEVELRRAGLGFRLVYSGKRDLDFLPPRAGKGNALLRVAELAGVRRENILVAGDSGNDADMFAVPGVLGVIVANRGDELALFCRDLDPTRIYPALRVCAGGVHDALVRLGWLTA